MISTMQSKPTCTGSTVDVMSQGRWLAEASTELIGKSEGIFSPLAAVNDVIIMPSNSMDWGYSLE